MNISSPFHTWHSIVDARHNVEMTHHGGTDDQRRGAVNIASVLAGADDNLGSNLKQLSASVAWQHFCGGFSFSSIAPYLSLFFFASDSLYRGHIQECGRM